MPTENRCWQCTYCDKEHVKVSAGVYAENGIGHCAAENSKANGKNRFHAFVFERTMQIDCAEFKPITQKIITKHPKMSTTIKTEKEVEVKFIHVEAGVRYWEDATVNGVDDELGELIPCRDGDYWKPVIDINTGQIQNWVHGTVAHIHYKVCDDGKYSLVDENGQTIKIIEGYVPAIMRPNSEGCGDCIMMDIDENGFIQHWNPDLLNP